MKENGQVKVYIEKPDEKLCFKHATCWLPEYRWEEIYGFSNEEVEKLKEIIESFAQNIINNMSI
jgi:hypothetical protein